jgi:penicillin-binding protein 1A
MPRASPRIELKADPTLRLGAAPAKGGAAPAKRRGRAKAKAAPAGARRRWGIRLVRWGVALVIWAAIGAAGFAAWLALDLPDTAQLAEPRQGPSIVVASADGAVITRLGGIVGRPLGYDAIDPDLIAAVLAIEDRRFFDHGGVDLFGLLRATAANVAAGRVVQGGSTITQQLAKNLFLGPERTFARKARELMLALWLEHTFDKRSILAIYLNRVYFGAGAYGIDAAAQRYFDRSAGDLTLSQAAMLAGLLKAPTRYAPTSDLRAAQARAALVLDAMADAGAITAAAARDAKATPAEPAAVRTTGTGGRYFADWVLDDLGGYVGPDRGDVVVATTLDARLQAAAEQALADELTKNGADLRMSQGALVVLAPDGAVLAMVGGRDYQASQFNRATQARRQPGSAFKLFVFAAALEAGLRPTSRFTDTPVSVAGFAPRNYDDKYYGEVTLAEALARSLNSVTLQVAQRVGIDRVIDVARRFGVAGPLRRDLSLVLGSSEVSLLELTSAYAVLPNDGHAVLPYGITEVRDPRGNVLYARGGSGGGAALDARARADLVNMLTGVVTFGTGTAAAVPWPVAGKTGTSEDYRDAWFVGFTRDLVAGVWVGNDDNAAMAKVTGGGAPARVFARFMTAAMADRPVRPLLDALPPVDEPSADPEPQPFDDLIGDLIAGLGLEEPSEPANDRFKTSGDR